MIKKIEKKVYKEYFEKILSGDKNFELRLADFEISKGDILILKEIDEGKNLTGRIIEKQVTFVIKTKIMENFHTKEEIEKFGLQVISFRP